MAVAPGSQPGGWMTAASTPPSSIRPTASSVVNAVTYQCAILLGRPLPQTWIWASTICMVCSPLVRTCARGPDPTAVGRQRGARVPLRACGPASEVRHDPFGKFGQLILKHLPRHSHNGTQIDALEAWVLLLDTEQVVDDLLGGTTQPGLAGDGGLEGRQLDARVAPRIGYRGNLL